MNMQGVKRVATMPINLEHLDSTATPTSKIDQITDNKFLDMTIAKDTSNPVPVLTQFRS